MFGGMTNADGDNTAHAAGLIAIAGLIVLVFLNRNLRTITASVST